MSRPPKWTSALDASVQEACLAVRLYNDPAEKRALEGFVIHMHLAWLYLLHAEFTRDGVDFRYWDRQKKKRLVKVDGEAKLWELQKSMAHRWPSTSDPVRANLDLFIKVRNRLEHRYASTNASLLLALSGHAHALLVNYETELTQQFGTTHSLASELRVPLFIGSFTEEGEQALVDLRGQLPPDLQSFLTKFESGLDPAVSADPRFEFRLRTSLELASKSGASLALQFTRLEDMSAEERASVEAMGERGQVIIRDKIRAVASVDMLLPKAVVKEVRSRLPFEFKMHHFVAAWKHGGFQRTSHHSIKCGLFP